jgi:SynChlorMet cassette protein ScmD
MMSEEKTPVRNPVAVLREEFDDWAVLFNPDTTQAVGINPVGVAVWKLIDGNRSIDDVVSEIKNQYDDVPESAHEEVMAFIQNLTDGGFIGYEVEGLN